MKPKGVALNGLYSISQGLTYRGGLTLQQTPTQFISNYTSLWLNVLQHGFVATLPVVILGVFALTLSQMVVWFVPGLQSSALAQISEAGEQAVYGLMAVILVLSISAKLARHYQQKLSLNYDPMLVSLLAMVCLGCMVYLDYGNQFVSHLGVPSVAKALFCAIVFTEIFVFLYHNRASKFSYLNHFLATDLHVAIRSVWPALIAPILFLVLYYFLAESFSILGDWYPSFIGEVDPQTGLTWLQASKLILVNQLSWFVGVHGSSILEVYPEIILPHRPEITFSKQFIDVFVHIGGAGGTLGLVLALIVSCKRSNRKLGYYALAPSLFNINELIIFGLPIIFNRYMLIPFLLVPLMTATVFRVCFEMGWVQWQGGATIWSTPVLMGGYLATGQWQGAALQGFCILLSFSLYFPFLNFYQRKQAKDEALQCKVMLADLEAATNLSTVYASQTQQGRFSRILVADLKEDLHKGRFELHYQPKVDANYRVVGAEALFRWHHRRYGQISPTLAIKLAEISGDIHGLGERVIERSLGDLKQLKLAGIRDLKLAVNVSPIQLSHPNFVEFFLTKLKQVNVNPSAFEMEITEGQQIELTEAVLSSLQRLSNSGISIAVDDFGMGYTSLRYLKSFPVNTLKIDGSIVKDVLSSVVVQEIISSMSTLAHSMDVQMVAEWVETEDQLEKLQALGCDQYQGQLISMPITLNEFVGFCAYNGLVNDAEINTQ